LISVFFLASDSFSASSGTKFFPFGAPAALAAMPVAPLAVGISGYSFGTLKL
jgi:hypothetical protein